MCRKWGAVVCCPGFYQQSITEQSKAQRSAAQHSGLRYMVALHSMAPTAQRSTTQHSTASPVTSKKQIHSPQADDLSPHPSLFRPPRKPATHLAKVVALQVRSPTLNLKPHALHVMQVVCLVPVLGEQRSCLLCLLYLPCPELPLGSLAVQKPAPREHKLRQQLADFELRCVCRRE